MQSVYFTLEHLLSLFIYICCADATFINLYFIVIKKGLNHNSMISWYHEKEKEEEVSAAAVERTQLYIFCIYVMREILKRLQCPLSLSLAILPPIRIIFLISVCVIKFINYIHRSQTNVPIKLKIYVCVICLYRFNIKFIYTV